MAWITAADIATFLNNGNPSGEETTRYGQVANTACGQIEGWCDRTFEQTAYHVWLNGSGTTELKLPQFPVINLYFIGNNIEDAFTIGNTSTDATGLFAVCEGGQLVLTVVGGVNAGTETLTLATYGTMALLVAAIVALAKGWTATVRNEGNPQYLKWEAHECDSTESEYFSVATSELSGVRPDVDAGILYYGSGWAAGYQNYFVHYSAGYATVPADLTEVAKHLAVDLLEMGHAGRYWKGEKSGDDSRTMRDVAAPIAQYAHDLAKYRRVGL